MLILHAFVIRATKFYLLRMIDRHALVRQQSDDRAAITFPSLLRVRLWLSSAKTADKTYIARSQNLVG